MRIYLAVNDSSTSEEYANSAASILRSRGFEVYCPWETKIPNVNNICPEDWANRLFGIHMNALYICDYVIVISNSHRVINSCWEAGYGYAIGKQVVIFSPLAKEISSITFCGCQDFINGNNTISLSNYPFDGKLYHKENSNAHIFNQI